MRFGQQMRRAWRRNALRGKVPANIQIRGIFPLLDCLWRARALRAASC